MIKIRDAQGMLEILVLEISPSRSISFTGYQLPVVRQTPSVNSIPSVSVILIACSL
jgi:hypothetical protein